MSSPQKKRDVVRLRTFTDDVAKARGDAPNPAAVPADTVPTDMPTDKGVFHTVKKKDLELTEIKDEGTELDAEGITFNEETAAKVAEQAVDEQNVIKTETAERELLEAVSDANSVITPTTPVAPVTKAPKAGTVVMPPKKKDVVETADSTEVKETENIIAPPTNNLEEVDGQELTGNGITSGEIVSDKKRERFKLIPAIGDAVSDWFSETKEQIEEAQREKHTVGKVASRVETIKAAAQKKTLAPEEDFSEVAERLRRVERKEMPAVPVTVKPKQVTESRWTHTTGEDQTTELPPTETAPTPVAETPTPVEPVTPPPQITPAAPEVTPVAVAATPEITPATTPPITPLASDIQPDNTPTPIVPTPPTTFTIPDVGSTAREYLPSPMVAIVVVIIAIVAGVGTSLFFFGQPSNDAVVPVANVRPLFTAQQQTGIDLTTHGETMSTLLAAINSNPNTVYMYLTHPDTGAVVSPTETMAWLAPQVPGSFNRSVTNVSFGADQNRPFIVMKVNDFDAAFSGMLDWEQTMSADLAPMFGPVVTESFDPQARTADQTRTAFYRDMIASNLSARLLTNDRGEDRIIYAFVDKQTIVITTDRLQLANVLPLIR